MLAPTPTPEQKGVGPSHYLRVAARLSAPGGRRFRLAPRTPALAAPTSSASNAARRGDEGPAATARVRTRSGSPVPQSRA